LLIPRLAEKEEMRKELPDQMPLKQEKKQQKMTQDTNFFCGMIFPKKNSGELKLSSFIIIMGKISQRKLQGFSP